MVESTLAQTDDSFARSLAFGLYTSREVGEGGARRRKRRKKKGKDMDETMEEDMEDNDYD